MKGVTRNYCPWPFILLILSIFLCSHLSQARHHPPTAVVIGTVFCDACFQDNFFKGSHYISGATVAVKCEQGNSRPAFYQEVTTKKQGNFKLSLPFYISKHVKQIEGCTVKLLKSSEPSCAVASTATTSSIHFKGRKRGKHVFSAGFFSFKPLKQPGLCNQKPAGAGYYPSDEKKQEKGEFSTTQFIPFFPPVIGSPPSGILPPNPLQPAPLLPNPLQPPPAPLIPNPFQPPSPPPSLIPPLPRLLPPMPNLPPIPLLTPPAPPPPSPAILPFPPLSPLIPGIPSPPGAKKVLNP